VSDLAVILLTFNSRSIIERTVNAAARLSTDIAAVDSGSTDGTIDILTALGCRVFNRAFTNYSDQRNWAIERIGSESVWQLHLDADEVLDDAAISSIKKGLADPGDYRGFLIKRRTYFLNRPLRFGGTSSWHMRLFRTGHGMCEQREYDQHFICTGRTKKLGGVLHDANVGDLSEWTSRHNRWSDAEVKELLRLSEYSGARLKADLLGDSRERRRFYKSAYYKAPSLIRPIAFFVYRYFFLLGFVDGKAGFLYAFFQALWFRMLVDAKLLERKIQGSE